jgi:predicted nucleic acid-binding protein
MTTTAVDTSVLVAALLSWHEAHVRALAALRDASSRGKLVVPAHALVEAYAVLTRMPAPHRLAPADAHALLSGGFEGRAEVVALSAGELWRWMAAAAAEDVGGGLAYDAQLLACAKKAKADRFLTFDAGDFSRLDAGGVEIVVP